MDTIFETVCKRTTGFLVLLLAGSAFFVGACNTVEGAGEDIEAAGDSIEDTADDASD